MYMATMIIYSVSERVSKTIEEVFDNQNWFHNYLVLVVGPGFLRFTSPIQINIPIFCYFCVSNLSTLENVFFFFLPASICMHRYIHSIWKHRRKVFVVTGFFVYNEIFRGIFEFSRKFSIIFSRTFSCQHPIAKCALAICFFFF